MSTANKNRLVWATGALLGAIFGYFYPGLAQGILPVIGLGAGLFYFFGANSVNKDPDKKQVTDFSEYTWYVILRGVMGFLIGSAVVSTILLVMEIYNV